MWPEILQSVLTATLTATVIFVVGYSLAYWAGQIILRQDRASIEGRLDRLVSLNKGCAQRMDQRRRELSTVEEGHAEKKRELYLLKRRLADIIAGEARLIRSIGEDECRNPRQQARKFIAHISNEPMMRAEPDARDQRPIAPDWAHAQDVIVWATDQALARQLAERTYPISLGFLIHSVRATEAAADPEPALRASA